MYGNKENWQPKGCGAIARATSKAFCSWSVTHPGHRAVVAKWVQLWLLHHMGLYFLLACGAVALTWPIHLLLLTCAGTAALTPAALPFPPRLHQTAACENSSVTQFTRAAKDPVTLKTSTITLLNLFHSRCEEECFALTFFFLFYIDRNEATSIPIISTI